MSLLVKNVRVTWTWAGDSEAVKGFNIAVTKQGDDPISRAVATAQAGPSATTFTFDNILLNNAVTYTAWVQAIYEGQDSDWVNTGGTIYPDDGANTLETTSGSQSRADSAQAAAIEASFNNAGVYTKTYSVTTAAPAELKNFDDTTPLNGIEFGESDLGVGYMVTAVVLGTTTVTGALALFVYNPSTSTWTVEILYQRGNTVDHPQFYLDGSGKPALRLYNYNTAARSVRVEHQVVSMRDAVEAWASRGINIDGTIRTDKVISDSIAANAVIASKIADAAITTAKFAAGIEPVSVVAALPSASGYTGPKTVFLTSDGKLYRYSAGAWTAAVPTTDLTGQIATAQISDSAVTAQKIANASLTTAKFAAGITPVEILGALPSSGNFDGRMVFLTTDKKLYRYDAGAAAFKTSVATADLTGQITSSQITDAAVTAAKIADASLTTAKFASGLTPVEVVSALPSSGNFEGRTAYLTTDDKLYRYTGSAWTAAVAASDVSGTISSTQIADDSITTPKLAANAVTAAKIAAGTITANEIAADTITAGNIAAGAITTSELAANAVTAAKIAAGTITSNEIAANTITAGNIAAATITGAKIAAGTITASNIAAGTITATEIAADTITAGQIAAGAISTSELAANAVTAAKIAVGTITSNEIAANTITAGNIAAATITGAKIAANTITAANIAANTITANEIAADTITAGQIAAGAISTSELAANAVTAAKIAVGTITANEIAAATITGAKIAAGTITASLLSVTQLSAITSDIGSINAGTITGALVQTDSSGKRFVVDKDSNEAHFYGDRGDGTVVDLASFGINPVNGDDTIAVLGTDESTRVALSARGSAKYLINAVRGGSDSSGVALRGESTTAGAGILGKGAHVGIAAQSGSDGFMKVEPSGGTTTPTNTPTDGAFAHLQMNANADIFVRPPNSAASWRKLMRSDSHLTPQALINFSIIAKTGTYARTSGNTYMTVTITSHGLSDGMEATLDFTSGGASTTSEDGTYPITVTGTNTFTIPTTTTTAVSGNVTMQAYIRDSENIFALTDLGTGAFRLTFSQDFADANITPVGAVGDLSGGCQFRAPFAEAPTVSTLRVAVVNGDSTVAADRDYISLAVYGTYTDPVPFSSYTSTFDSGSGSTVIPHGATSLQIKVWGGGAGGEYGVNSGGISPGNGGDGGNSGAYTTRTITIDRTDWGKSISYVVGAGGSGGNNSGNATAGSASTVTGSGYKNLSSLSMSAGGGTRYGNAVPTATGGTTNTSGNAGSAHSTSTGGAGAGSPNGGANASGGAAYTNGSSGSTPGGGGGGGGGGDYQGGFGGDPPSGTRPGLGGYGHTGRVQFLWS